MAVQPTVAVTIVTFNSARFIRQCLQYVFEQDYAQAVEVVVVDNASSDETRTILQQFEQRAKLVYNEQNVGFAAGQNQAMGLARADWLLALNPDVRLTPNFVSLLTAAGEADTNIGSVCGKLLAMAPDLTIPKEPVFDSTGIFFTPNLRHFDRGSQMADRGQYERFEYVFGATGAACLYRRKMMDDIALNGEYFDADFFAYREDADLAWRAQLYGWKCLYTPLAVAYHVRHVLPETRSSLPALINMHSVKNRWLMRIKNITADLYARHFIAITVRDLLVIAGCLLREFSSLRGFVLVARSWRRTWAKRRTIMQKRRVTNEYMAAWFRHTPVSFPALEVSQKLHAQQVGSPPSGKRAETMGEARRREN
jgi:GT2 family glycosyltransferase